MRIVRGERALSSTFATVILLFVTIVAAAATAYYISGIAGTYAGYEMFEIKNIYALKETTCWNITIEVVNSGSIDTTLISVYINDRLIEDYSPQIICTQITEGEGLTLKSGQEVILYIQVPSSLYTSGTFLNLKLHSAGGMDYIKLIELT